MTRSITVRPFTRVLVIGGGLAGMYAAIAASRGTEDVRILSKGKTGGSGNSVVAMSVHRFAPDAPVLRGEYRARFLKSGAGEQIPETAEYFVDHAAACMEELRAYGLPLEYRCLEEDGAEHPYLACCRPKQGRILTAALRRYMEENTPVRVEDGVEAIDLLCEGGRVCGVLAESWGELLCYPAGAVVLACGGAGNVYAATSNTSDVTGDGYAMALRLGLPLTGMEFVQFYPYRIYSPRRADIFPDVFEHGAVFRNERGERFMDAPEYPAKELENRDVVARAMFGQKEVRLDLSGCDLAYLEQECPNIYAMYAEDPARPLLLRPVAHFFMGGVPLRPDCSTAVGGLFVCGETAGGLHGANRLAGSALTETVVFGHAAGRSAAADSRPGASVPEPVLERAAATLPEPGEDELDDLRARLREMMWKNVSLLREESGMEEALAGIREIGGELAHRRPRSLREWSELRNMLAVAEAVTRAALERRGSLGAHYRSDA